MNKFWTNVTGSYKIDPENLHEFLNERGFYTFKPESNKSTILVKTIDKQVRQVTAKEIRELCWRYIESEFQFQDDDERKQVKAEFQKNKSYFHKDNIELLPELKINEIKDTKEKSYIFFRNCIFEITAESIVKKSYDEVEGHVFETDIIFYDFKADIDKDYKPQGEFFEFVKDICKDSNKQTQDQNFKSMITIIGYLLHRYKHPANAKAIVFMDSYKNDNPNGGTGKGLLTKAFKYIREATFQDGKFYTSSNRFGLSQVEYGTRVLVFDDVPKTFDFEKIFPLITEEAVIERKFENKFTIPFEQSPKVLITTNYTVEGSGESHKRRKVEFIFSDTFNADYSPEDKFGHLLFMGWDNKEWENFYLFIAHCLQMFLMEGIVLPKFNVLERKLKIETTQEFMDFMNDHESILGDKYNKQKVYEEFYDKHPNHYKVEKTTFRNWLKLYADAYGFSFHESHSGDDSYFELWLNL